MAQPSSAQREPSMEEILSSIRRIIEDSDSEPRDTKGSAEPKGAGSAQANAGHVTASEKNDANSGHTARPQSPAQKSLAEIQREIAGEQAELHPASQTAGIVEGKKDIDAEEPEIASAAASGGFSDELRNLAPDSIDDEKEFSVPDRISAAVASKAGSRGEKDDESVWAEALKEDEPEATALQSAKKSAPEQAPRSSANSPILSPDAGRRVAASFEQLSEAFMESRVKAFDTKAEELLRPMLQEWLDENLPTLVERLVREEIERVARGGS